MDENQYEKWGWLEWGIVNIVGQALGGTFCCAFFPCTLVAFGRVVYLNILIGGMLLTVAGAMWGALVGSIVGRFQCDVMQEYGLAPGRWLWVSTLIGAIGWATLWALIWIWDLSALC